MINPMSLDGKRILITGASSGIGRACAVMASQLGARAVLVARRQDALEDTCRQMECSESHQCICADLSISDSVKRIMDEAVADGKLDGLVHAAGVAPILPIGIVSDAMLQEAFRVNVGAFVQMARFFSKKKYGVPGGSLVAVSSVAARTGWPAGSVYCASKGAISSAVQALALEFAHVKTRVNAVLPSYIDTPMFSQMSEAFGERTAYNDPVSLQPLGLGRPEQVASAVCFLLSDAASFITGTNLPVDGGYLAR